MRKLLAAAILLAYAAFILSICWVYFRGPGVAVVNRIPFRSIRVDLQNGGYGFIVNFVGNVVAFLPFGGLLPIVFRWGRSAGRTIVACGMFSLLIEVGQWVVGGRVSDVDDLMLNTLGGALGYGLWWVIDWSNRSPGNLFERSEAGPGDRPGPP